MIQFVSGETEYISKRNRTNLNSGNPEILKVLRANTNPQAVLTYHTVIKYIGKYAVKVNLDLREWKILSEKLSECHI